MAISLFLAAEPSTKLDVFGQALESKGMVLAVLIVLISAALLVPLAVPLLE